MLIDTLSLLLPPRRLLPIFSFHDIFSRYFAMFFFLLYFTMILMSYLFLYFA